MLRITRRDFLKYCSVAAGALGLSASSLMRIEKAMALNGGTPVIWMSGAACTGCTMTFLNSVNFGTADDILINTLDLKYLDTAMSAAGAYVDGVQAPEANALAAAQAIYTGSTSFVLVVEGAIPTATPIGTAGTVGPGDYCRIGNMTGSAVPITIPIGVAGFTAATPAAPDTMLANAYAFANHANCIAVLGVGTCASFGGIPGAKGGVTGAKGLCYSGTVAGGAVSSAANTTNRPPLTIAAKTYNISGCPPHPDWIVGTIAAILADDTASLRNLTTYMRLRDYYGQYQCNAGPCPWRFNNTPNRNNANSGTDNSVAAPYAEWNRRYPTGNSRRLGTDKWRGDALGCLGILGCKGRKTKADCSARRWNADSSIGGGVNWCVGSRAGCHGCTEPTFPDKVGKFFTFV
jgi:hydrogenase small subunit